MAAKRGAPASDDDPSRQRILDAAESLFADRGFDATPTAQVAASAGVAKGLLFYYFPKKIDLLRALLEERLPTTPLTDLRGVIRKHDTAGSLTRLARALDIAGHESLVLRTIIFREASTHPEVRDHVRRLRQGLFELVQLVIDGSCDRPLSEKTRKQAAQTFVAVMLDEANARRFGGAAPDIRGAANIVAAALASS